MIDDHCSPSKVHRSRDTVEFQSFRDGANIDRSEVDFGCCARRHGFWTTFVVMTGQQTHRQVGIVFCKQPAGTHRTVQKRARSNITNAFGSSPKRVSGCLLRLDTPRVRPTDSLSTKAGFVGGIFFVILELKCQHCFARPPLAGHCSKDRQ